MFWSVGNPASATAQSAVLPFEAVQDGAVTMTPAPDGLSALLQVRTTIAMVCAVTYGETSSLGQIATDAGMAGAAQQDHAPILNGLKPDTEYVYRLQGVGQDGNLYQSELLRFRTPVATGFAPLGPNVAIGATVVAVSSEFSSAYAARNAVDGRTTTEWSSLGDGDHAFIAIDLGQEVNAIGVGFRTRQMADGSSLTTSFSITTDDGATYGPFSAGQGLAVATVAFTSRTVRFNVVTSTGGNTGAVEVEVYTAS
ncbi:MAG: hypothetical protein QOF51_4012 [Chloroflexota bacterium]|jgi:hypothetical protein|nr:hypothetical protein [Chloroflexota bacterium]